MGKAREEAVPVGAGTIRVLVADDDPTILRLVETALPLTAPDIEVVGTEQHADALQEAIARLKPDLVMVDHHFDARDGIEVGRELARNESAPVLVLWTGTLTAEMRNSAVAAGFKAVVEKDADLEGLAVTIRKAVSTA